jgi:hypothetical protein
LDTALVQAVTKAETHRWRYLRFPGRVHGHLEDPLAFLEVLPSGLT